MGTKNDATETTCTQPSVKIHRCVSVLPNDYSILENLPKINGVTLLGDLTTEGLNLLSSETDSYESVSLEQAKEEDAYLLVIQADGKPKRVSLSYLKTGTEVEGGFQTVDEVNGKAAIGSYQFVEKK